MGQEEELMSFTPGHERARDQEAPTSAMREMTAHRRGGEVSRRRSSKRASCCASSDRRLDAHRHRGEGANRLPDAAALRDDDLLRHRVAHAVPRGLAIEQPPQASREGVLRPAPGPDRDRDRPTPARPVPADPRGSRSSRATACRAASAASACRSATCPRSSRAARSRPEMVKIQERVARRGSAQRPRRGRATLCANCGEPLRADCLVNYRRKAWQDAAGELRVTLDSGLAFYRPPDDLWDRDWALLRSTLGDVGRERAAPRARDQVAATQPAWLPRAPSASKASSSPRSASSRQHRAPSMAEARRPLAAAFGWLAHARHRELRDL